jgi:hypothetical protein
MGETRDKLVLEQVLDERELAEVESEMATKRSEYVAYCRLQRLEELWDQGVYTWEVDERELEMTAEELAMVEEYLEFVREEAVEGARWRSAAARADGARRERERLESEADREGLEL